MFANYQSVLLPWCTTLVKLALIESLIPFFFVITLLFSSFSLFVYKKLNANKLDSLSPREFWKKPITIIAKFWKYHSKIFHGHEVIGLENIPDNGGAIIVFYHSGFPVDFFYAAAKIYLYKNRKIKPVIEKTMFQQPGLQSWLEAIEGTAGTVESCVADIENGEILATAPGGVREMLFSSKNYELIWNNRSGFAKIAIQAKAPIIPLFTQNCRELTFVPNIFKSYFRNAYEQRRINAVPFYGWFPVKLRTIIGKPIEFDEYRSVDQLVKLTKESLEDLIKEHQRLPGSICYALLDRFNFSKKKLN